jgi:hyperosmotically inducible periplasmic protein
MRIICFLALSAVLPAQEPGGLKPGDARPPVNNEKAVMALARNVQRELIRLPQYSLFDHLRFGIKGYTIYLRGFASRPTLKADAERVVKSVEGVEKVVNEIEVLPLSRADEDVRAGVYVAIYGHPALARYNPNRGVPLLPSLSRGTMGITTDPPPGYHPIHILVKNGQVTLEGVVANTGDRTIAEMQANGVFGAFSVTNNLIAASEEGKPKKR